MDTAGLRVMACCGGQLHAGTISASWDVVCYSLQHNIHSRVWLFTYPCSVLQKP